MLDWIHRHRDDDGDDDVDDWRSRRAGRDGAAAVATATAATAGSVGVGWCGRWCHGYGSVGAEAEVAGGEASRRRRRTCCAGCVLGGRGGGRVRSARIGRLSPCVRAGCRCLSVVAMEGSIVRPSTVNFEFRIPIGIVLSNSRVSIFEIRGSFVPVIFDLLT